MVVDSLRRIGPPGALAEEDELVEFGAAHSVVVFEVLTPHRVVDLYAALLAGFNLVDEIQVSGENRRPSKIFTSLTRRPIVQAMMQNSAQRYCLSRSRYSMSR